MAQLMWRRGHNHGYVWKVGADTIQKPLASCSRCLQVDENGLVVSLAENFDRIAGIGAWSRRESATVWQEIAGQCGAAHQEDRCAQTGLNFS